MNYTANGSIRVGGCADCAYIAIYNTQFSAGDIVYSRPKALQGIWEKIVIKKVKPHEGPNLWPLYVDTLNSLHNEVDLVSYADAVILIEDALIVQAAQAEEFALKCR